MNRQSVINQSLEIWYDANALKEQISAIYLKAVKDGNLTSTDRNDYLHMANRLNEISNKAGKL